MFFLRLAASEKEGGQRYPDLWGRQDTWLGWSSNSCCGAFSPQFPMLNPEVLANAWF